MRNDYGFALVIALIMALLLSLLCLSVTLSSMSELRVSSDFENHEKALLIAEAGFNLERRALRGNQLDDLLAQAGTMFSVNSGPTDQAWAVRNPISPIDARNLDFEQGSSFGSVAVTGMLTPAGGTAIQGGRYFARLSDNPETDNDTTKDSDGTVYLRVVGIVQGLPSENSSYGTSRKNSVAIIEGVLHRDTSFDMTAPMSFLGPSIDASFSGQPFTIDGYDHTDMTLDELSRLRNNNSNGGNDRNSGNGNSIQSNQGQAQGQDSHVGLTPYPAISCLDPNNATGAVTDITNAISSSQSANVIGLGGTPSVVDGSDEVKTSTNPDTANVLDPAYLQSIAIRVAGIADIRYEGDQHLGGSGNDALALGSVSDPKITYVHGNLDVSGNIVGSGILLVTGDLGGNGSLLYDGLVLVLGSGRITFGGSNNGILGGIVVANLTGTPAQFGESSVTIAGNSNFFFKGDSIRMAISLLAMRTLSWREITPEIEPVAATPSATPTL